MATLTIISFDGQEFKTQPCVAKISKALKRLIEDLGTDKPITIPSELVTGDVLEKILTYCQYHLDHDEAEIELWDKDFVAVEKEMLFKLIMAANYLEIQSLLDLMSKNFANIIKNLKTKEVVGEYFNFKYELTPEQEEKISQENAWLTATDN